MDAHCCSYGYLQLAPSSAVSLKWLPMNDPGLFVRAGRLHFGSGSLGLIFMPMRSIGRYTRRAIIPGRSPWVWNVCEAAKFSTDKMSYNWRHFLICWYLY